MKKVIIFIFIIMLILAVKFCVFPAKKTVYYTALGDSIAEGYSASDKNGYTYMLEKHFEGIYKKVYYKNMANSGDLSSDLKIKLETNDEVRDAVRNSDIITISIGGNDLLSGFYELINGNFLSREKRLKAFSNNLKDILSNIKALNPKADIYVMNLYNPVSIGDYYQGIYCNNHIWKLVDNYIVSLNQRIADNDLINTYKYKVVDIYSVFMDYSANGNELTNFKTNSDPHPNDKGHEVIFYEHYHKLKDDFKLFNSFKLNN